ncbi:ABC transporter ATP-binding protein [Paludibaculum fermentans]|uniref:ABC transporter ATP-binding protein n=1 Tax=Paludibaculum fermentans TaxID=1473598 RepID=UPI003EBC338F
MRPALRTYGLTKRYRGTLSLDGLDLDVPQGSIFGLVGPNGAGKTTTIQILMNLVRPTSGRSEVLGRDSAELGPEELTRIGYVSENQQMPDWMTIDELLAYLRPFYPTWDDALARRMMADLSLPGNRKLRHLSRGMRMKTALVSSLAYYPELLILDEPFSGLDPLVREEFIGGVLNQTGETTVLLSSHDLAEIESFASHIAYLDEGRLRFSEEMDSLARRFRQIEVRVDGLHGLPRGPEWPEAWLSLQASQALVRFVDTRFDEERTPQEIHRVLPGTRHISAEPMPLRAIFVALARSGSAAGAREAL